jgi:hypothetical protein
MKTGRNILMAASLAVALSAVSLSTSDAWGIPKSGGKAPRPWLKRKKGRGGQ